MTKIKSIRFSRLNNAEMLNHHRMTLKEAQVLTDSTVKRLLVPYQEDVDKLAELMFTESEKLMPISAADKERDLAYTRAKACAKAMCNHFDKGVAEAAARIYTVFANNANATKASLNEESTILNKVVHDLEQVPADICEKAFFTGWAEEIKAKQDAYENIVNAQNEANIERAKGLPKSLREKCMGHYRSLVNLVSALSFAGENEEFESFANRMNLNIQKQMDISATRVKESGSSEPLNEDLETEDSLDDNE